MTGRTLLLAGIFVFGASGWIVAYHDDKNEKHEKVRMLAIREIAEKVDGKDSAATVVEVTLLPGQVNDPHRHPGAVFGYIVEGEYEWAIEDQPSKVLKAGDTFYEPSGCLHRVSKNPGKVKSRMIALMIHDRNEKRITIPEPKKK